MNVRTLKIQVCLGPNFYNRTASLGSLALMTAMETITMPSDIDSYYHASLNKYSKLANQSDPQKQQTFSQ